MATQTSCTSTTSNQHQNRGTDYAVLDNVNDPTHGQSLVSMLVRSRRVNRSAPRPFNDTFSSLGSSLSSLTSDVPQLHDFDNREEWLCAILDQSFECASLDDEALDSLAEDEAEDTHSSSGKPSRPQ